ncbi:MAG: HAD-IIB family hydrolase [Solobacterium sp.]|nr:HAD-IIB family hydrolase [Solobacterium sp.]
MKYIQLVASDIDGTLLLNGAKALDSEIFKLIRKLHKKGILFMAASGREYTNLHNLFAPVADDIAFLCLNGCLTFYHNECISKEIMDTTIARKLITTIQNDSNAEVLVSGEKTCYITPKNQSYYGHLITTVKNHVTVIDDLLNIPESYTKISAYFKNGVYEHYQDYVDMFNEKITVQIGGKCWLDCAPKGVNKSIGFLKLLSHLSIPAENTVMFGDNDNDKQILQTCGYPITMETAVPSIYKLFPNHVNTVNEVLRKLL